MTSAEFIAKWHLRFADNNTGEISESDLRDFTTDMAAFFGAGSPPAAPDGVSWTVPPTITISGADIIATDAEAEYGEDLITFPAETISVDFAGSGLKRKDIFGAYYLEEIPHFGTITGTEVAANAIAFSPVIPEGFLPLSYLDVTDGAISQNPAISEKFKGKWFESVIEADTYWVTSAGIWRAKRKFGSSTAPTAPDTYWELVFAGGASSTDAVAEGTTNKYFTNARSLATVLTGYAVAGTNAVLAASDTVLVAFGKLQKQINDLLARPQVRQLDFNTSIATPHYQRLRGKWTLTDRLPEMISSVAYETQLTSETVWTPRANLAAVNTWANSVSVTETTDWRIKRVATPNGAVTPGLCEILTEMVKS